MKRYVKTKHAENSKNPNDQNGAGASHVPEDSEETELPIGEKSQGPVQKSTSEVTDNETEEEGTKKIDEELITRLRNEAEENYDKYLRAIAELENAKKRAVKERSELLRYAGENLARDLVTVLDDIERALSQSTLDENDPFQKGIQLIYDRFLQILAQHSIRAESSLGKTFDPEVQEALALMPTDEHPPGIVIQEHRKAYFFKDKLLRTAQVVVSAPLEKEEAIQENKGV